MVLCSPFQKYLKNKCPLSVDEFLKDVLYHEDYGYYAQKNIIGSAGDYITAPEVSQVFGELIALWFIDLWYKFDRPVFVHLIELGPGHGTLIADILQVFKKFPDFFKSINLHLVEKSPSFRNIQQQALKTYPFWHVDLKTIPVGFTFLIANEFFDALLIKQFLGGKELFITANNNGFYKESSKHIKETCPQADLICHEISYRLKEGGGAALIIDYGDAVENRSGCTLQALYHHQKVDLFDFLGESDISHQVDFLALKDIFLKEGLYTFGTITQSEFLTKLGLEERTKKLIEKATFSQKSLLLSGAARLISPQHMGQIFKVLSVVSNPTLIPEGFHDPL